MRAPPLSTSIVCTFPAPTLTHLVRHGLGRIKHDKDQVARTRCADDLPPTAFAVLGALDNPWEVYNLDLGALVIERALQVERWRREQRALENRWCSLRVLSATHRRNARGWL